MKTFEQFEKEFKVNEPATHIIVPIVMQLEKKRKELNWSQRELSRRSGVPQKTISNLENVVDIPRMDTLLKVAHALGFEVAIDLQPLQD